MNVYGHQPYNYGYPQQYPPPQSPNYRAEMESLWSKMKDMEGRIYGSNPAQGVPNQNSGSFGGGGFAQNATRPSAPQISLIPVSSEEEAWEYPPDFTGATQYFHDPNNGCFYTKTFDANIPRTYKTAYKRVEEPTVSEDTPAPQSALNETMEAVSALSDKIDELTEFVRGLSVTASIGNNNDSIPRETVFNEEPTKKSGRDEKGRFLPREEI